MRSEIKELYLVFEDYMGKLGVVGIFKDGTIANHYKQSSPFTHIRKIYTDCLLEECE